jgi:putative ABC transport system permease protein
MAINVLERTREIGIMRAIGASNRDLFQVVIVEALVIAALSWVLGALAALPLAPSLSAAVGTQFIHAPLAYTFSGSGALIWLGGILVLASLASLLPAWNASRLTVRDVLAYE